MLSIALNFITSDSRLAAQLPPERPHRVPGKAGISRSGLPPLAHAQWCAGALRDRYARVGEGLRKESPDLNTFLFESISYLGI